MNIGKYNIDFNKEPVIMGILNITPDSFSDGGKYNDIDAALQHTRQMIEEGAKIIDVGGESTRPGYTLISDEEEINRVVPVIEAIKKNFDVPVSLDTYKAGVAQAGIAAGCDLINDVWGFKVSKVLADADPDFAKKNMTAQEENALINGGKGYPVNANVKLAKIVADSGLPVCIMHNKDNTEYSDFVSDVVNELKESIEIAHKAGVKDSQIILDPGVGFGKTYEQNLLIIKNVDKLLELGYPVLLGTSRKSVIGLTLDVDRDDRMAGTVATTVMGLERGCRIFRVHDVKENYQAMMMAEKILNA